MYELAILSLLMQGPAHGYLIMKVMNDVLGPYTKFSHGRLYPMLARLEAEGFIVAFDEGSNGQGGGRPLHRFQITEAGRKRFHELMMDTISNPGDYQKLFLYKVQAMEFLQPAERIFLLDYYLNFCQSHVFYLTARVEEMQRRMVEELPAISLKRLKMTLTLVQHVANQWRLEFDWAGQLRAQEIDGMSGLQVGSSHSPEAIAQ